MKKLLEQVRQIVLETGNYMRETHISSIEQKEGRANFVTDLDLEVQNRLVDALTPLLPDASFILEESHMKPHLDHYTWIIDPIDGTQNFIKRYRMSAISVGLVREGEGVLGMVYNPFMDELFYALKDQGAFLNQKPIHVSERPLENSIINFGTAVYYEELREKCVSAMKSLFSICGDFRRTGSAALDLCYTACGRCDGFFEYRLSPWDFAAASVIIKEAGGMVDSVGKDKFSFSKPVGIVAGNPTLFHDLKQIVDSFA